MSELIVLGSGTAVPSARRSPSGYFLHGDGVRLLLDSGPGTLGRLARAGVPVSDVTIACYTHFHPDHTLDLMALVFALTNPRFHGSYERLTVVGPRGLRDFYERMRGLYGRWMEPRTYELDLREIDHDLRFEGFRLRALPTEHTENSVGYRVDLPDGAVLAYSGDTDFCAGVVELGREADLFVLECSFPDGTHREGHLTPSLAGKIAAASGCRRLLLTHFYPECDETDVLGACREHFDGDVLLAEDGLRLPVDPRAARSPASPRR